MLLNSIKPAAPACQALVPDGNSLNALLLTSRQTLSSNIESKASQMQR
jgi:hypothetical protein